MFDRYDIYWKIPIAYDINENLKISSNSISNFISFNSTLTWPQKCGKTWSLENKDYVAILFAVAISYVCIPNLTASSLSVLHQNQSQSHSVQNASEEWEGVSEGWNSSDRRSIFSCICACRFIHVGIFLWLLFDLLDLRCVGFKTRWISTGNTKRER